MVHEIATALLPVFLVLALGYGAGRREFIDSRNVSTLNQLVMMFAIPAPLFVSISSKQRSAITSHGTYLVVIVIATLYRSGSALGKSARPPPPRHALAGLAKTPPPNGRLCHYQ